MWIDLHYIIFLQLIILPYFLFASASQNVSKELHERLFEHYEVDDIPSFMQPSALVVSVTYHLTSIMDLNELAGEMVTVGYLTVTWLDPRLTWNPFEFGGITYLMLTSTKVWTPNLVLGNPSRKITNFNADVARLRLLYNGTVIFMPGDVFHTRCDHNIYRYPFDDQECHLSFLTWPYTASEVKLVTPKTNIRTGFFQENGEWSLLKSSVRSYVESSISVAEITLSLERRSEFFIVNIILPIVSICFLACLVFLIPHESGERISYTITVLLSFAVFMTLVSDNIPKTSAPMSLLCYYLFALFFGSVLIMLNVIFNSRLFHKSNSIPIPGAYKRLGCIVCGNKNKTFKKNKIHVIPVNEANFADDIKAQFSDEKNNSLLNRIHTQRCKDGMTITWQDVARAFDKICFVAYLIYFVGLSCGIVLFVQV